MNGQTLMLERNRLHSIDVLRALTMFLMIFVNDVSSVSNIPKWIEHAEANEDRLGFADTIFPAFLFIAGLSIPLAVSNRINKGNSTFSIAFYIFWRAAALIVMGFFHVNSESYSSAALLSHSLWMLLVTVAFFLIWLTYPASLSRTYITILRLSGVVLLMLMAYFYRGGSTEHPEGMQPSWWGILGIIGWAYLVSALLFLLARNSIIALAALLIIFFTINILSHLNLIPFQLLLIDDASSVSLMMAGVLAASIYQKYKSPLFYFLIAALGCICLGWVLRPFTGGISKINSTPAWVLICTGINVIAFCFFIVLVDKKGKAKWFNAIKPAGTSTLTCYLVPYLIYSIFELLHFWYPSPFNSGIAGILRSFAISFLIILMVGLMQKRNFSLKL